MYLDGRAVGFGLSRFWHLFRHTANLLCFRLMAPLAADLEKAIALCSTEWLKTLLRELLPKVANLPNTTAGHRQAQQWDALVKSRMAQRGLSTPNQQKNPITDVRRVLKAIDAEHPALDDVGFSPEEWTAINMPSEQAVGDRTAKSINDPDEIARRASVLLQSDSWSELAAGLAVATGRRAAEVIQTAQFKLASKWSVWFAGAVKRRGEPIPLEFELPTLVEAASVISATKRLRKLLDTEGMSNREINRAYSNAIAQACDRTFADLVPVREGKDNLYTHLFRSVYSTIATFWYCPPAVPELEFRAAIQGHYKVLEEGQAELRRSLAASRHYFDYEIADNVIAKHQGQRKGIKLVLPGVEVISAFRAPIEAPTEVQSEEPVMSRIGITEDDKQRVLSIQDELSLGTQQDAMQVILDAADTAISLAGELDCQPVEVGVRVGELSQQVQTLQAKLSEAERMLSMGTGSAGTNKVIEQSLAMAHEFNSHLKGENERLKEQLGDRMRENQELQAQLGQFQAMQQQLQQFQQLFNQAGGQSVGNSQPPQAVAQPVANSFQPQKAMATAQAQQPVSSDQNNQSASRSLSKSEQIDREVEQLIREIMQYNDQQAADDSERWQVNQSTLKQLTTTHQNVIKRVIEGDIASELQAHHDQYGLHGRMANRGKDIDLLKTALGINK